MNLLFPHHVHYEPRTPLSPSEIAQNLIAQERLIIQSAKFLEFAIPGLLIEKVNVTVPLIQSGSLREEFLVSIWTAFQEDLTREVTDLIQGLTGINVPDQYDSLVTLGVLSIALYGALRAYRRARPAEKEAPASIQGNYNTVINVTAQTLNMAPQMVETAVERSLSPLEQRNLAPSVLRFFAPAKKGGNTAIVARKAPQIEASAVAEVPRETDLLEEPPAVQVYPNTLIEVRATDRDRSERGWAARLPEVDGVKRRLPMQLSPGIIPETVADRERFRGDVLLELQRTESGEMIPKAIHLMRIIDA